MKLLKSEKIALATIKRLTVDCGNKNAVIKNAQFNQVGLKGRNKINEVISSLVDKDLIVKRQCNNELFRMGENWIGNDKYFRYQIKQTALLYMFSELEEVG